MSEDELIDRAIAHHRSGRLEEAAALYQRVLQTQPDHLDALHLLGTIAYQRGDACLALELIGRAIAVDDRQPTMHNHLGLALLHQGRPQEAVASFRRALELRPAFAPAHHNLGRARRELQDLPAAAECFRRAWELDPTFTSALADLAEVLLELGRPGEAVPLFQQALALSPDHSSLHRGLGDALHALGELAQAVVAYRRAVTRDESSVRAWWGLGCAQSAQGEYAAAAMSLQKAVEIAPDAAEAHHNLGKVLFEMGQVDLALDAFRRAAALRPHGLTLGMIATIIPGSPRADDRAVAEARRAWAAACAPDGPPAGGITRPPASAEQPLRIGYVSAFFHHRNWMKPVWGLINHHDRDRFEIHLFSDAPEDSIQHGYRKDPRDRFHDITGRDNADVARLIEKQEIDLLIDLNGYSRISRLPLFALRPARVLVAWFNLFAPSGMGCFDYVIGDEHVLPAAEEAFYPEHVVRVPGCYLTFEVAYPVPEVAPAPCLSRGAVTFGCLAPQYKITTPVVEAWARILRRCPASRLVLKNAVLRAAENRAFVRGLFAQFDVPLERVELDGPAEHHAFLGKYAEVDVALDTFPYNGGTTTMEAIWQGVPVLTFAGDRWASRIGTSLLRNAGLPEFVAPDLDGYVRRAIELANDPDTPARLGELRRILRDRLRLAPVCDVRTFAREMERRYLFMWRRRRDDGAGTGPALRTM